MERCFRFLLSVICLLIPMATMAATPASNYVSANTYNNMYPYMNNRMRTSLNPGVSPSQNNAAINTLTRTYNTSATPNRRVVPRNSARMATNTATPVRSATVSTNTNNNARRVVARSARPGGGMAVQTVTRGNTRARATRNDNAYTNRTVGVNNSNVETVSSTRCLADYTQCMNEYCERENTAYNRCYCSSKLAQIDSEYQPEIDRLIKEILTIQGTNQWSTSEMNDYWMSIMGNYSDGNSWTKLDAALDIDWASTESRVRGQNAFKMGHDYCSQHLRGCGYMASNLRDAYRSDISRDCTSYEASLQKLKNAAESIVEAYK